MRAVVWTELLQAGVYVAAASPPWCCSARRPWPADGRASFQRPGEAGKLTVFDFYTGFDRPYTIFAGFIGGAFLSMASHGADQLIVQRLLSARSLKDAQRAIIGSGITVVFVQFALFLTVGIGLWAFYGGGKFPSPDAIFPTFIFERMPHGLIGLLVAAILAATMSTHSGAINSLAASTTHDIYLPLTGRSPDDPQRPSRWGAGSRSPGASS